MSKHSPCAACHCVTISLWIWVFMVKSSLPHRERRVISSRWKVCFNFRGGEEMVTWVME